MSDQLIKPLGRRLRLLLIQPDAQHSVRCLQALERAGYEVLAQPVSNAADFQEKLSRSAWDLIIADVAGEAWSGLDAARILHERSQPIPFILLIDPPPVTLPEEWHHQDFIQCASRDHPELLPLSVRLLLAREQLEQQTRTLLDQVRLRDCAMEELAGAIDRPVFLQRAGEVTFANAAAAAFLGEQTAEALRGRTLLSLLRPESRGAANQLIGELARGNSSVEGEVTLAGRDGTPVRTRLRALPLSEGRAAETSVWFCQPPETGVVSAQQMAELARTQPWPVLVIASSGEVLFANAAAESLMRLNRKERPGELLPADYLARVEQCLVTRRPIETSMISWGAEQWRWMLQPEATGARVFAYAQNISELDRLEAQLRHAQKFEPVGKLAGGIAHDFNNILTVIQGHTGLLRSEPSLSSPAAESVQQISRAAERAASLVNQLLIFSRRNLLHPRRVDLNEVLAGLGPILQRTLGEDIHFQFSYGSKLPPIHADPDLIQQVVLNLVINARDAMPRGGQLLLSTARVEVDEAHAMHFSGEARAGSFVCLSVVDSGCGMDSSTLSRLFEPFFTTKDPGQGTGLGLATVYSIVKQHHGWIEVQSHLGQGSNFKVFLPLSTEESPNSSAVTTARLRGDETILVVEDEPPVRWTIKEILERNGYRILEAASGVEALAVWHQYHDEIALLLTDIVMPAGLTGQELAKKFQQHKPELKVIYTSGYSPQSAGRDLAAEEGTNFLHKPFSGETLLDIVHRSLHPAP